MVFVFLSYAKEYRRSPQRSRPGSASRGVQRFDWLTNGSGRFLPLIESAISRADAFIALMSPHFMASKWCSRERDLALFREQQLQEDDQERAFVHVVEVGRIRPDTAGFLGAYNWVPFTGPACRIYKAIYPEALRLEGMRLLRYAPPARAAASRP